MGSLGSFGSGSGKGSGGGQDTEQDRVEEKGGEGLRFTWRQKGKWRGPSQSPSAEAPHLPESRTPSPPTPESTVAPHLNFRRKDRSGEPSTTRSETISSGIAATEAPSISSIQSWSPPPTPLTSILETPSPRQTKTLVTYPPPTRLPPHISPYRNLPQGKAHPRQGQFLQLRTSPPEASTTVGSIAYPEMARADLRKVLEERRSRISIQGINTETKPKRNSIEIDWRKNRNRRNKAGQRAMHPASIKFTDQAHPERSPSFLRPRMAFADKLTKSQPSSPPLQGRQSVASEPSLSSSKTRILVTIDEKKLREGKTPTPSATFRARSTHRHLPGSQHTPVHATLSDRDDKPLGLSITTAVPSASRRMIMGPYAHWPSSVQPTHSISHTEISQIFEIVPVAKDKEIKTTEYWSQNRGAQQWVEFQQAERPRPVAEEVKEEIEQHFAQVDPATPIDEEELQALEGIAEEIALEFEIRFQRSEVADLTSLPTFGQAGYLLQSENQAERQGRISHGTSYTPPLRSIPIWRTGAAPSRLERFIGSLSDQSSPEETQSQQAMSRSNDKIPLPISSGILHRSSREPPPITHWESGTAEGKIRGSRPVSGFPAGGAAGRHSFVPPITSRGHPSALTQRDAQQSGSLDSILEESETSPPIPTSTIIGWSTGSKLASVAEDVEEGKGSVERTSSDQPSESPVMSRRGNVDLKTSAAPSTSMARSVSASRTRDKRQSISDSSPGSIPMARETQAVSSTLTGPSTSTARTLSQSASRRVPPEWQYGTKPALEYQVPGSVPMSTRRRSVFPIPLDYLIPGAKSYGETARPVSGFDTPSPLTSEDGSPTTTLGTPSPHPSPESAVTTSMAESPSPPSSAGFHTSSVLGTSSPPTFSAHDVPSPHLQTPGETFTSQMELEVESVEVKESEEVSESSTRNIETEDAEAHTRWQEAWLEALSAPTGFGDPLSTIEEEAEESGHGSTPVGSTREEGGEAEVI
ncbi:hypothetical protein IAR55_004067 [Kwoniella newhampshirensis]|uniref:Uncharacterized protein n=1 Tax=Kwoniella newhampshirensis TaxID=1651941 RepID=A0AAW0YYD8_9TREE